jgi:hypothetical protein
MVPQMSVLPVTTVLPAAPQSYVNTVQGFVQPPVPTNTGTTATTETTATGTNTEQGTQAGSTINNYYYGSMPNRGVPRGEARGRGQSRGYYNRGRGRGGYSNNNPNGGFVAKGMETGRRRSGWVSVIEENQDVSGVGSEMSRGRRIEQGWTMPWPFIFPQNPESGILEESENVETREDPIWTLNPVATMVPRDNDWGLALPPLLATQLVEPGLKQYSRCLDTNLGKRWILKREM